MTCGACNPTKKLNKSFSDFTHVKSFHFKEDSNIIYFKEDSNIIYCAHMQNQYFKSGMTHALIHPLEERMMMRRLEAACTSTTLAEVRGIGID